MLRIGCLLVILLLTNRIIYSQEEVRDSPRTIPNMLRRPDRGEAPRVPRDLVIGDLGQGDAPGGAYQFARNLISTLVGGSREASGLSQSNIDNIEAIRVRNFRIGGGRIEPDGSISFLVRFIGPEESITGELFLRQGEEDERWRLDDLILEERRLLREIRDNYRFDFTPYERFY